MAEADELACPVGVPRRTLPCRAGTVGGPRRTSRLRSCEYGAASEPFHRNQPHGPEKRSSLGQARQSQSAAWVAPLRRGSLMTISPHTNLGAGAVHPITSQRAGTYCREQGRYPIPTHSCAREVRAEYWATVGSDTVRSALGTQVPAQRFTEQWLRSPPVPAAPCDDTSASMRSAKRVWIASPSPKPRRTSMP